MNLKVRIGKLTLPAPIVCASGTFGYGDELKNLADYSSIGAVIAKTITLKARAGNKPPRIYETAQGVINSVGLENPGLEGFIKEKLPKLSRLPVKRLVSVGGFSLDEYQECVRRLEKEKGFDAFEINLSCPNIRLKKLVSQDAKETRRTTRALRSLTQRPLIIKITPEVTDVSQIARAVQAGGADAVSLVNTYFAMAINIETQKPVLGNLYGGYSGPAIKPMSLYRVWQVVRSVRIPVIGGGGIETAEDAIEFFLAGATAVSLGTVNLVNPNQSKRILAGIEIYLRRRKLADVKQIRGVFE